MSFAKNQCWFQTTGAIFTIVKKMSSKQLEIFWDSFFEIFLIDFAARVDTGFENCMAGFETVVLFANYNHRILVNYS